MLEMLLLVLSIMKKGNYKVWSINNAKRNDRSSEDINIHLRSWNKDFSMFYLNGLMPQAILASPLYMRWLIPVISLCNRYLLYTFCVHGMFLYFNELLVIKKIIIIIIMPSTIVVWGVTGGLVGHFWLASQFGEQIMKLKDSVATCGLYWLSLFLWVLRVPAYPWFNLTGPDSWEARLVPIGQWLIPQPPPPNPSLVAPP